jgi:hypothetical protein
MKIVEKPPRNSAIFNGRRLRRRPRPKLGCGAKEREREYHSYHKMLSFILPLRLTPYVDEITEDHHCKFRRNRSNTDQIFCILEMLEKKWEYNGILHQLFIDFKKAYDAGEKHCTRFSLNLMYL